MRKPKQHYVYVWFDGNLPIYVGMGQGNRAWEKHYQDDGRRRASCESLRQRSREFRVCIIADDLTSEGARVVERTTIEAYSVMGLYPVGNVSTATLRSPKTPLTITRSYRKRQ